MEAARGKVVCRLGVEAMFREAVNVEPVRGKDHAVLGRAMPPSPGPVSPWAYSVQEAADALVFRETMDVEAGRGKETGAEALFNQPGGWVDGSRRVRL